MPINLKQLEQLQKDGRIKSINVVGGRPVGVFPGNSDKSKGSKAKDWMFWNLTYLCSNKNLTLVPEFKFDEHRKFRFDYCIIESRIGIEYEGLMSEKSIHTTVKGYTGNCDKYNLATCSGWKVLRYTALNYKEVLNDIKKLL